MTLGVGAFDLRDSGLLSSIDAGWSRTEYGPAVAGRATSARLLDGRMGATDMPPALTAIDSGRALVGGLAAGAAVDCVDVFEAVRTGEIWAMADPGRAGRFLLAAEALFWASIASRRLGLLAVVLRDKLLAGRAAVSVFLGELGLLGSLFNSFCAVASRSAIILVVG